MPLKDKFKEATDRATKLPKRPPNDILLQLYALYKQVYEGDVSGERPGFADFEDRAKFDACKKIQGTSPEEAMQEYIDLVSQLEAKALNETN